MAVSQQLLVIYHNKTRRGEGKRLPMARSRRHCAERRDSEGKLIMTARRTASIGSADTAYGTDLRGLYGGGGCAAAEPGAGRRDPAVVPRRLSGALRRRADRRQCRTAMSAAQSGEPVVALPDRCQRDRGRGRAQPVRRLAGQAGAFAGDGSADDAARGGRADASLLRRRFPRLVSRRGSGRRQGDWRAWPTTRRASRRLAARRWRRLAAVGRRRRTRAKLLPGTLAAPAQRVGYCSAR